MEKVFAPMMNPKEAKKVGAASYEIAFTSTSDNAVLTFFERYDPGWQLSGFEKNHFRMNGYANGWLIEKSGTYHLSLAFKPQKMFAIGVKITAVTAMGAVFVLLWKKLRKR